MFHRTRYVGDQNPPIVTVVANRRVKSRRLSKLERGLACDNSRSEAFRRFHYRRITPLCQTNNSALYSCRCLRVEGGACH